VRIYGKSLRYRKAVGSIIGGTFILLILLSGYAFYVFSNRAINAHQQVLSEMSNYDVDRSQESIEFNGPPLPQGNNATLTIALKNNGPKSIKLISYGVIDKTPVKNKSPEIHNYTKMNLILAPAEEQKITIIYHTFNPEVDDLFLYKIQIITERGNIFETKFPDIPKEDTAKDMALDIIGRVIGYFVPHYFTFGWTEYVENKTYQLSNWTNSFTIPKSEKKGIIFRLNVTYYGPGVLTLSEYTEIFFIGSQGSDKPENFIIFDVNKKYNNEKFGKYGGSNIQVCGFRNATYTLYFGSNDFPSLIGSFSPSSGRYGTTILILNDKINDKRTYGQSIPFFAIEVIK